MLSPKRLQRHMKGAANYRRISILILLEQNPDLSLVEIAERLKWNLKTTADHIRRLSMAGLVSRGRHTGSVPHKLTKRGQTVLKFLRTLE
ncbi:winged helix-turn-helix domain-containing protein [Candidatus Saccharibacteria bacterium]|nr:winged helix-turn-helix domain-containing protein [Candidatus Saccharibacteria bacterium]